MRSLRSHFRPFHLCSLLLALLLPMAVRAQEGYRLLGDRVVVEEPEDWSAWESPPGVRLIDADGTVEPRFLRRDLNVALNAGSFIYIDPYVTSDTLQGGIGSVGTSPETAPLILDGDPATYWEPDSTAALDRWYLEIDLGRAVVARRVVVRFVDEGQGDPFLRFRVMISDGERFGQEQERSYRRVGLINSPNKQIRQFSFDVNPWRPTEEGVEGEVVQFVRLDVLDSDGPRAEEVSLAEYEALPPDNRGAIDFFRVTISGRQIAVSQPTYEALPPEEQGPIRRYRRERPRLAEVEVYALGENVVVLTQRERKRDSAEAGFDFLFFRTFTDGLFSSWFPMRIYDPITDENQLRIDLGAKYWLERIHLLSPESPPPAYQVRISEGDIDPSGELIWTSFPERRNLAGLQHLEEEFPQQEVRYIDVRRLEFSGNQEEKGNLSEVQAFGEGYVSEVAMTSPFIPLQRPRLFERVTWEGEVPPGTRIEVRTRSGDEIREIPHYFATTGREITKALWELISENRRPPIQIEKRAGSDWSSWSELYGESGERFKSPSPRVFVQTRVRLVSREPLRAARLRRLTLHFGPPLVDQMVGEIFPVWQVEPGVDQTFTLHLRPVFGAGNPGFDRLRLRSSSSAPIALLGVRAGSEEALRRGSARQLWPGELEIETGEAGTVELVFPQPVRSGEGTIYEIEFSTRVFLQSTIFSVEMERASRPGILQEVSPGDASQLLESQGLLVVSELQDAKMLGDVRVEPAIFTPNGDGINDETAIRLSVFHLEGEKELEVDIRDLNGRRVRDLSLSRSRPSGEHVLTWDGRDDAGDLLPPGIYLVRIHLATDYGASGTRAVRLVHLVY